MFVWLLVFSQCLSVTSHCPRHQTALADAGLSFADLYVLHSWDHRQAASDPHSQLTVEVQYIRRQGLRLTLRVLLPHSSAEECPSILKLHYNFFLDPEYTVVDECTLPRQYPTNYRLRLNEEQNVLLIMGCVAEGPLQVLLLQTRFSQYSRQQVQEVGQLLMAQEGLANVQMVPVPAFNWSSGSVNKRECLKNCSLFLAGNGSASGVSLSKMYDPMDAPLHRPDDSDYSWKISAIVILVFATVVLLFAKRSRSRRMNRVGISPIV